MSSSKCRLPKVKFAKFLRIVVQRAGDAKFSVKMLPLLPVVKVFFSHIWDVLSNVPCFQSEYRVILRHPLAVSDYRFHLRNRIYCSLMRLYIEKVETSLGGKSDSHGCTYYLWKAAAKSNKGGSSLVEQFLDVVYKELDPSNLSSINVPWTDATKDDKFGALSGSQYGLVELAVLMFYKVNLERIF